MPHTVDGPANPHGPLLAKECLLVLFSILALVLVLCSPIVLLALLFREKEEEEKWVVEVVEVVLPR